MLLSAEVTRASDRETHDCGALVRVVDPRQLLAEVVALDRNLTAAFLGFTLRDDGAEVDRFTSVERLQLEDNGLVPPGQLLTTAILDGFQAFEVRAVQCGVPGDNGVGGHSAHPFVRADEST